ncbi:kinase-like protein [Trametes versicolor FP-101664 SS1]|uniref:kinase-like protein n=1 Tax=Trametes versicolor (strain FP-101664) TaxID=717944 RepID=UPI0004623A3B|nr:kinase-like protein [Trametes versicolor FP-101664 SS1]EIW54128.1 kinase-like protein [Trametes versicolor FP-101664 SS1]
MSAQEKQKRLPRYAVLEPENVEYYATSTRLGRYGLLPSEIFWNERYRYLEESGYVLRPRYAPNWKPSWSGTNLDPMYCEDAIMLKHHQVIDARRRKDNELVAIKRFRKDSQELHVAQFLTSVKEESKHTVPVLAVLPDPYDNRLSLMVMPHLRPCNDPEFGNIGEVIEFIDQMIEGLVFLHRHRVAHRDIALVNIMMDAKPLYPDGYHPVRLGVSADALYDATPLPRTGRSITYYYIDFGFSVKFPEGSPSLVVGDIGRDAEVPELSHDIPYDAFPVDIYALGNLFFKHFAQLYNSMEFLLPLIEQMKRHQPETRPTAAQVLREWKKVRGDLNESLFRWRLGPKSEPAIERMFKDTVAVAWEGVFRLRKLVG